MRGADHHRRTPFIHNNNEEERFLQLDHAFSELRSAEGTSEDQRYPFLGYNSHTDTVTVVTAPSSIHECSTRWIDYEIFEYARQYLFTRRPHTL
ncbi:hypothetical protein V1509DRAFT_643015 [Lipomyces kononenkoae]